jgi:pimeloyl-ACP methyl ester carboxylesterase
MGQVVALADIDVYYEEHGEGPPLILLHGGMGSGEDWVNQVDAFSEGFRVIVPDSRGQGSTTDGEVPLTYELMAEDTIRLMDHLGIEAAYVAGFSDGGNIGLYLAIRYPDRVRAAAILGANITPEGMQQSTIDWLRSAPLDDLQAILSQPYLRLSPQPERLPIIVEKMRTLWLTEPDLTSDELGQIRVPILVTNGESDELVRPGHPAEIASAIPGAELALLPGVGHNALSENPTEWNRIVLDFFARH